MTATTLTRPARAAGPGGRLTGTGTLIRWPCAGNGSR